MKQDAANKMEALVLTEKTVSFGGMLLEYRLLGYAAYANRFRICILMGEERAEYAVGNDLDTALQLYHAVVGGRVTPCGLRDVLDDLCG